MVRRRQSLSALLRAACPRERDELDDKLTDAVERHDVASAAFLAAPGFARWRSLSSASDHLDHVRQLIAERDRKNMMARTKRARKEV